MSDKTIANRYELRGLIGGGGSADVYLAYDRTVGREVALKKFFGSVEDPEKKRRIDKETKILTQIKSKHVVPLHDSFVFEDHFYLVFERMDHSLADPRYDEGVEIEKAKEWARDALTGLKDVHACGVIHRDIKPGNLFLDERGSLYIGDFGVAQTEEDQTQPAVTVAYVAPEISIGDQEHIGPNSDLFSLGLVLYRMLLGDEGMRKAFSEIYEGVERAETISYRWLRWLQKNDPPPLLNSVREDIPEDLARWILRLVEKDPVNRFQSAEEALKALDAPRPRKKKPKKKRLSLRKVAYGFGFAVGALILAMVVLVQVTQSKYARLNLAPEGTEGIRVRWDGEDAEKLPCCFAYRLRPTRGGWLEIYRGENQLVDTVLTVAGGDEVSIDLTAAIERLERAIMRFHINTAAVVHIEGEGERDGEDVTFTLRPGEYAYKVSADGYETCTGRVKVEASEHRDVEVVLESQRRATAAVYPVLIFEINTEAMVDVDDRWSRSGSRVSFRLAAGEHTYKISADGYRTQTGTVNLLAKGVTHEVMLEPAGPVIATLGFVMSTAAIVEVAGQMQRGTEVEFNLEPGEYPFTVSVEGCDVHAGVAALTAEGASIPLRIELPVTFEQSYGGGGRAWANAVRETEQGGYILAGAKGSGGDDSYDIYLVKTREDGQVEWEHTYGGNKNDQATALQPTSDGGFVVVGWSESKGEGSSDVYLFKTDSKGELQWQHTYGSKRREEAMAIQPTLDRGYVIAGTTEIGGDNSAVYLIKTDSLGQVHWEKTLGTKGTDCAATDVALTKDGGYAVVGWRHGGNARSKDVYLMKVDPQGLPEWERAYGGAGSDVACGVHCAEDSGYVIGGWTQSKGLGSSDFYLIVTDAEGLVESDWTFGGRGSDVATSMCSVGDGGYVIAGWTHAEGGRAMDVYMIKVSADGDSEWERTFGGNGSDKAGGVCGTEDGGFAVAGWLSQKAYLVKTDCRGKLRRE